MLTAAGALTQQGFKGLMYIVGHETIINNYITSLCFCEFESVTQSKPRVFYLISLIYATFVVNN